MKFIIIGGGCYGIYHSGQLYKAIQKGKLPADSELIIVDRNAKPPAMAVHGDKPNFRFVQSDWQTYLQDFFGNIARFDYKRDGEEIQIVPAPFAPHLMFDWLQQAVTNRLRQLDINNILLSREGFDYQMNLPFESTDPSGNHYISRAGWTCPTACIEPHLCPAVKNVRDWDLANDVSSFVARQSVLASESAAAKLQAANLPNGAASVSALEKPLIAGVFAGTVVFTCHHFSHGIGTTPAIQLFAAYNQVLNAAQSLTPEQPITRFAVATVSHCHGVVASLKLEKLERI